jgi:integrase/recombinase XerD
MSRKDTLTPQIKDNGLTPYMHAFLEWGKVKNISKDTLTRRHMALKKFIHWCHERDLQQPQHITKPILERYQRHVYYYRKDNNQPLTLGSQHAMLSPLKSFFKWLTQENYLLYNPASELELPRKPRRLPKTILHIDDVDHILNQTNTKTDEGVRDRAIMETLYSTGIRRAECVSLTLYDIDVRRRTVMIQQGKGGKDRLLPIGQRALSWIEHYRLEVRPDYVTGHDNGILFLTDNGEKFKRGTLSGRIKRYIVKAGLDVQGSCHLFRHAMATHMLENGADIRFIQAMLGHADLSTTQIYTQVSIEKLKQIHAATHPAKAEMKQALLNTLAAEAEEEQQDTVE